MQFNRPSFDDYDEINSPRDEVTDIDRVIETAISRRGFLGGAMSFGLGSFLVDQIHCVKVHVNQWQVASSNNVTYTFS